MLKFPRDLYSDVRVEDVAETTLVLEDGELKQCTESRRRGAFVRVYDGKRWYNSATTEPDRLQQELDTLAAMAEPNPAIGDDPVVRRFEVNRDCVLRWRAGDLRAVPVGRSWRCCAAISPCWSAAGLPPPVRAIWMCMSTRPSALRSARISGRTISTAASRWAIPSRARTPRSRTVSSAMHRISRACRGCQEGLRAAIAEDVNYAMHAVPVEPGNIPACSRRRSPVCLPMRLRPQERVGLYARLRDDAAGVGAGQAGRLGGPEHSGLRRAERLRLLPL